MKFGVPKFLGGSRKENVIVGAEGDVDQNKKKFDELVDSFAAGIADYLVTSKKAVRSERLERVANLVAAEFFRDILKQFMAGGKRTESQALEDLDLSRGQLLPIMIESLDNLLAKREGESIFSALARRDLVDFVVEKEPDEN